MGIQRAEEYRHCANGEWRVFLHGLKLMYTDAKFGVPEIKASM